MTIFLIIVGVGVVVLLFILFWVSRELWTTKQDAVVVERIPSAPPVSIADFRNRTSPRQTERSA